MRVVVSRDVPNEPGIRSHYCLAVQAMIGLRIEGLHERAELFCPMCGALAPWERESHIYNGLPQPDGYDGPLCEHGRPDVTCLDLASSDSSMAYQLSLTYAVREYPAAALAERYGCAPSLIAWVRYCVECRNAFARAHFPVLRHEIETLQQKVGAESRDSQRALISLAQDIRDLHGANEALSDVIAELPDEAPPLGFVYLIGHASALKIGWTQSRPQKKRLAQLQTATEKSLELRGFVLGTMMDERRLHERFARHRIRGEWFAPAQEILTYFQENHPVDGCT